MLLRCVSSYLLYVKFNNTILTHLLYIIEFRNESNEKKKFDRRKILRDE